MTLYDPIVLLCLCFIFNFDHRTTHSQVIIEFFFLKSTDISLTVVSKQIYLCERNFPGNSSRKICFHETTKRVARLISLLISAKIDLEKLVFLGLPLDCLIKTFCTKCKGLPKLFDTSLNDFP